MPVGNMLAQFGNRPSLMQDVEGLRNTQMMNRLGEYKLGAAIRDEQKQNRLSELYSRGVSGDKAAFNEMASVSPEFHMQIQKQLMDMDKTQREQLQAQMAETGRVAIAARANPQLWAQEFPDIPYEQADVMLAKLSASKDVFDAIQEQEKTQYGMQKDERAFGLQEQGLNLQARGQDITLRGQDLTNQRAMETNNINAGGNGFKDENTLRDEFNKASSDFVKVRDAYSRIKASAQNPSAAGDISLIFNYMKMLDPGSTVREGEFATAQNATGVPQQVLNQYNKVMSGERLSPVQRADFVGQASNLYAAQEIGHNQLRGEYENLSKRRGLNTENVVIEYRITGEGSLKPKDGSQNKPAAVGDVIDHGGKKYRITRLSPDGDHDIELVQ